MAQMTMFAPSIINAAARELAGRENLLAKLFDNPQRAQRMLRMRFVAEDHSEFRQNVLGAVESFLNNRTGNAPAADEGSHEAG